VPAAVFFCCIAIGALARHPAAAADGVVIPLPADDEREITRMLGAGVVGQALPSRAVTDATKYFPLQERTLTYLVTTGQNAGALQTLGVAKGKRPAGNPAWRLALSPSQAGFIRQTPTGDLIMSALSDSGEGVIVFATPANPFLLNGMQPGETRALSQSVSVNYLDDPTSQDYSGKLAMEYTYVGAYQVTVPAGTYQAILARSRFEGKIGPAHTRDVAYYFFAPQVGVVAMITQEDIEAFWIIHIDAKSGKVLKSID
jgi:hypothetical protein